MRIAVFSDVHDNFFNVRKTLNQIKESQVSSVLFLGDFINPGIANEIFEFFSKNRITFYGIFGNNDAEQARIYDFAKKNNANMFFRDFAQLEIDNKKICMIHFPNLAGSLAKSGDFDVVFYGDDHIKHYEVLENGCILANPGEVSTHKTGICSFLIWDTEKNSVDFFEIKDIINTNQK
jgi:putative phosphoesterase